MGHSARGWILFEIIIVLTIFAFISVLSRSFVMVNAYSLGKLELDRLYSLCLFLQTKAELENRQIILKFDSNNSYYFENNKYKLVVGIEFGVVQDVKGPPSEPTKLLEKAITYKNKQIVFFPDGTISSGSIYITDINRSFLFALTTAVSQYSYVRKYKYQKQWQELKTFLVSSKL